MKSAALAIMALLLAWPLAGGATPPGPGLGGQVISSADSPADARRHLQSRLATLLKERTANQLRMAELQKELASIKAQMEREKLTGQELEAKKLRLSREQAEARDQAAEVEKRLAKLRDGYVRRMRALYLYGSEGTYNLLGSSFDFNDYLIRSQYLTRIAAWDQRRLLELHRQSRNLNRLQVKLAFNQMETRRLGRDITKRSQTLSRLDAEHQTLLADLESEAKALAVSIGAVREAEARLARTFALDQIPPGPPPSARPAPPLEGRVLGRSGPNRRGVYMSAPQGSRVRAPWRGKVVYAAPLEGYGTVVILDHGNRMHTVLANLGRLSVDSGQEVTAGQVVGAVGPTSRLYLEVRRGARPVDPLLWLKLAP